MFTVLFLLIKYMDYSMDKYFLKNKIARTIDR